MIWLLLVIFQIKHFVCDFPLQGKYMLGKFKRYPDFIYPLLAHGLVHATATFMIALCFKSWMDACGLALLDLLFHSAIDFLKANPDIGGRFKALTKSDFEDHYREVEKIRTEVQFLGLSQNTLDQAAEKYAQLNDLHLEWHEKEKSNKYFWWALGLDQFGHHITHYIIIAGIIL